MPGTPRKNIYFAVILLAFLIARSLVSRSSGDRLSTNVVEVLALELAGIVFRERIRERILQWIILLLVMPNVLSELFPDKHASDSSQKHSSLPDALKRFCHHPQRKAKKLQTKPGNESVPWCQQCYPPVQNLVVCPAVPLSGDGNDRMRYEKNRFTSFHRIPQTDLPPETRPIELAGRGFYFDGNQRQVLCFSCGARYPDHHPVCTWMTENVLFREPFHPPASPPPIPREHSRFVMGVNMRPAHRASPANNPHPPGNAPPLPGYQPDSVLSDYSASPNNRPVQNPIRRHVTSGEEDEGALRRMQMDDTLLASSAIARGRDITEDQKEPAAKLPHQTTSHASEHMSSVTNPSQGGRSGGIVSPGTTATPPPAADRPTRRCRLCGIATAAVTFLPCGHVVCCAQCASSQSCCPTCGRIVNWKE